MPPSSCPPDLSQNVIGIFEGSDAPPTIYYYPNEKSNAVATKVSDSAAQTLVRQINQQFSSTVNQTIMEAAHGASDQMEARWEQGRGTAAAEIADVRADIDQINASLDDALGSIASWRDAAAGAQETLDGTAAQLPAIRTALDDSSASLAQLRRQTDGLSADVSESLLQASASLSALSARSATDLSQASANLKSVQAQLDAVQAVLQATTITDPDAKAEAESVADSLALVNALLETLVTGTSEKAGEVDSDVQKATAKATSLVKGASGDVMGQLGSGVDALSTSLSELSGALSQFEPQITQMKSVLSQTDSALATARDAIQSAKGLLGTVGANLDSTMTDIGAMRSALSIDQISELLEVDPDNVGEFISSPVRMETEKIYPVSNYGTAVAPFYTNLALWIGCFILISLLKLEVDRTGFEQATATQRYFGRWLLFVGLALLQSQVICGVDILLGIDCANPGLFMLSGAVCSFVYMNLLYALVIAFRNIGKTLCILLLIMQVPGSSGMYPIEMMPGFFQFIHPALPFTYGISAMREALCGMYGTTAYGDLAIMLAIVPVSLVLGLMFRPYLMNLTNMFDAELKATGFIVGEEHGQASDSDNLRRMLRALSSHESFKREAEQRARSFNRRYAKLRRVGTVAACGIPFVFIMLMSPWSVKVNTKLTWLVIMLVVLLVVMVGLIILEYMHRSIREEAELLGSDSLDELDDYQTLVEQADDARVAAEEQAEEARQSLAGELLDATPPLAAGTIAAVREASAGATAPARPAAGSEGDVPGKRKTRAVRAKRRLGSPARDIFFTDMRLGFHSVIGVVVIMLLVITPSLYAWFNIAGSWDPYSNTGNLKVAVANEDEGYKGELIPVTLNIGDTVVSQLRGNGSFDWIFVDAEQATSGVESGEYYAAIQIPRDFSRNMMTYLTEDASYPDVVYYTNEKENPIAPIITQKGADSIQENIRTSFTQRVDEVGLGVAYELLGYATTPRVSEYAQKMAGHLDDATDDMTDGAAELSTLSSLSSTVAGVVSTTGTALGGLQEAGEAAKGAALDARSGAGDASEAFSTALGLVEESLSGQGIDIAKVESTLDTVLGLLEDGSDLVPDMIDGSIADVDDLLAMPAIQGDPSLRASISSLRASLQKARDHSAQIPGKVQSSDAELKQLIADAKKSAKQAKAYFTDQLKPQVESLRASLQVAAGSTGTVVEGLEGTLGGLSGSTDGLTRQLQALSGSLSQSSGKLGLSAEKIRAAKERIVAALSSGDVKQMEAVLLGSDPEQLAERLAAPVQEKREAMYAVANYGSSMAPFYTVLSLWVGALVMISTMRVHLVQSRVDELRQRYARVRPRHEFFGRYALFGFVGLLQSALVLLGDLLFLQIQCVHPVAFFVLGLVIGQVFCIIVYTLTELFGDIGKALCVILLIMQVAASGGTFPVEMLDPLLEHIVPFLPFWHAMGLLQECVAGIYVPMVVVHLLALGAIVGIMLLVGVVVRRPFRKLNDWFELQLEKTGYM